MKNTCFGLMRIFGMIGFFLFGLGLFYKANQWFGLNIDTSATFTSGFGVKGTILLVASMLVGLLGLLIGQGIGASIPIRSDKVSSAIDIIWHYGANGSVVWLMLSITSISIYFGKETTKDFVIFFGAWELTIFFVVIALIMSWIVAFQMYVIADGFAKIGKREIGRLLSRWLPILTCMFVGIVQCMFFGVNIFFGMIIGFIAPFMIIPLSIYTKNKDYYRRMEMKRKG